MSSTPSNSTTPDVEPEEAPEAGECEEFTPEKLAQMCSTCGGKCCQYYTVLIDDPEDAEDFDELRWFLAHGSNYIYIDDGEWHLNVEARCKFLLEDGRCKIYDHRPRVCRDFGHDEECEFDGSYDFERVFKTIPDIEAYAREVLPPEELEKMPMFPEGCTPPE
jgi:Fe-S-cluster containining protein